jgi:hypothetical protein
MDGTAKRENRAKTLTPRKTSKLAQHVRATLKTGQYVEQTWTERRNVETGQKRPTPRKTSKLALHVPATLKTGQYVEETWPIRQNVETGKKRPTPRKTSKLAQHVPATLKTGQYVEETAKTWKPGKNARLHGKRPTSAARARDAENWPIR